LLLEAVTPDGFRWGSLEAWGGSCKILRLHVFGDTRKAVKHVKSNLPVWEKSNRQAPSLQGYRAGNGTFISVVGGEKGMVCLNRDQTKQRVSCKWNYSIGAAQDSTRGHANFWIFSAISLQI